MRQVFRTISLDDAGWRAVGETIIQTVLDALDVNFSVKESCSKWNPKIWIWLMKPYRLIGWKRLTSRLLGESCSWTVPTLAYGLMTQCSALNRMQCIWWVMVENSVCLRCLEHSIGGNLEVEVYTCRVFDRCKLVHVASKTYRRVAYQHRICKSEEIWSWLLWTLWRPLHQRELKWA